MGLLYWVKGTQILFAVAIILADKSDARSSWVCSSILSLHTAKGNYSRNTETRLIFFYFFFLNHIALLIPRHMSCSQHRISVCLQPYSFCSSSAGGVLRREKQNGESPKFQFRGETTVISILTLTAWVRTAAGSSEGFISSAKQTQVIYVAIPRLLLWAPSPPSKTQSTFRNKSCPYCNTTVK